MQKFKFAISLLTTLLLISCSSPEKQIIGTWVFERCELPAGADSIGSLPISDMNMWYKNSELEFFPDGTYDDRKSPVALRYAIKSQDTLVIDGPSGPIGLPIVQLNNEELILDNSEFLIVYHRK